jgi:hypothetical protein
VDSWVDIPSLVCSAYIISCAQLTIQDLPFLLHKLTYLSINIRFLYVQLVVGMVKLYLNTVGNVLVKDVYVLGKISKLKFLLELTQAVFLELLERVMPDREGM